MKNTVIGLSLLVAATAIVIGGTSAFFSDSETSEGNTFAAGTLDLKINGNDLNPSSTPLISVSNLKPGDKDTVTVKISNDGNVDGKAVYVSLSQTANNENDCTEPEANDSEDDCDSPEVSPSIVASSGELCRALHFQVKDGNEEVTDGYVPLDILNQLLNRGLKAGKEHNMKISYKVDEKAGNEVMSDSCVVSIKTTLQQEPTETVTPEVTPE